VTRQLRPTDVKRLNREWRRRTDGRLALVLDGVQSPYNVGSIVRSAAAFRVEHVWLAGATPPPTAARVRKLALGTERYLEWTSVESPVAAADNARSDGFRVIGIELAEGARPLHELTLGDAVCLLLGNEDHGLGVTALGACDVVAFVPQLGRVGSLNVAVAAAVAMYEVRRQHWAS
jgi:tRNA (guanosine-2'-O-)-methyltransferase